MVSKLLADLEFASLIGESTAQTATGSSLLDKYKSYCMTNEVTCKVVNNFISEANQCRYDNGVNEILERVSDYIQLNKTSWALTSICENLRAGKTSWNYLNQNAVNQVEKLLENDEETVNKYIKAGALKNVMYVTEFRNIAKQVYHDTPMIESNLEYTSIRPISFVENCGDGYLFEAAGKVIKVNSDKTITEASYKEVSNTFKQITQVLESNLCSFNEGDESLVINVLDHEYIIKEANKVIRDDKEMTVEQLRDNNRLMVMASANNIKNRVAGLLESIALISENFDHIAKMDNCNIYETRSDRFLVVCEGTNMFATLLKSNHCGLWTFNCNVVEALEAIKKNTRVSLSEKYNDQVKLFVENATEEDKQKIEDELKEAKKQSIKDRIEALTEKFKDDPTKLAILSQVAQDLQTAEED